VTDVADFDTGDDARRRTNPVVAAPIVGPTKLLYPPDAVFALDVQLTPEDVAAAIEEPYALRQPTGY
jgi:aryl-alcohol dehydrogenase-like predicted oxidoreductase